MKKEHELIILHILLLVVFAISIGGSSMVLSEVRTNMNVTYTGAYTTTHNAINTLGTFSQIVTPLAQVLGVLIFLLMVWELRRLNK